MQRIGIANTTANTLETAKSASLRTRAMTVFCTLFMALSLSMMAGCGSSAPAANTIDVAITVDASAAADAGYDATFADATVTLNEGATVMDALAATGLSYNNDKGYVSAINGLAEMQVNDTSGWMFSVNDEMPMDSAENITLNDGDNVRWYYVTSWE